MPTSLRLHAWLCVLLVLLQAVAPALHALQHHRASGSHAERGGRACACGLVHVPGRDGRADRAAPADGTADGDHCGVCEILRGLRVFHGPTARPDERGTPVVAAAPLPAPVPTLAAPRAQPFLARAPPQLLV